MANYENPLVVGVFQSDDQAKQAIDALNEAGFARDQIGFAHHDSGNPVTNLLNDLKNLGVPAERASYYDNEFRNGRPIVSVRADGRDQEANSILQRLGAYDQSAGTATGTTYDQGTTSTDTTYNQGTAYDQNAAAAGTTYNQSTAYNQDTTNTDQTYGQRDYNTTGQRDYNASDTSYAQSNNPAYANDSDEQRRLRLREEQLTADKQNVQAGEVRLHKDVVSEEQSIDVPVTHEEVYVERRPVTGGQVSDTPIGQDEVIRVPVSEEQVNVNKQTVETGEVGIGKRAVTENQQYTDTVRREEARVEREGDVNLRDRNAYDDSNR